MQLKAMITKCLLFFWGAQEVDISTGSPPLVLQKNLHKTPITQEIEARTIQEKNNPDSTDIDNTKNLLTASLEIFKKMKPAISFPEEYQQSLTSPVTFLAFIAGGFSGFYLHDRIRQPTLSNTTNGHPQPATHPALDTHQSATNGIPADCSLKHDTSGAGIDEDEREYHEPQQLNSISRTPLGNRPQTGEEGSLKHRASGSGIDEKESQHDELHQLNTLSRTLLGNLPPSGSDCSLKQMASSSSIDQDELNPLNNLSRKRVGARSKNRADAFLNDDTSGSSSSIEDECEQDEPHQLNSVARTLPGNLSHTMAGTLCDETPRRCPKMTHNTPYFGWLPERDATDQSVFDPSTPGFSSGENTRKSVNSTPY